jgi:membrane-associated phospholipid phosphatase
MSAQTVVRRKPRAFVFPPPSRYVESIADDLTSPLPAHNSPPPFLLGGGEGAASTHYLHADIDTPSMNKTLYNQVYAEVLEVQLYMICLLQYYLPKWIGMCLEIFHWLYQSEAIIAGIIILHFADLYGFGDLLSTANFGSAMLISEIINGIFKNFIQEPRPFWISNRIANPHNKFEKDFAFPSGHSQASSAIAFGFYFVVLEGLRRVGESDVSASTRYAFLTLLAMTFLTGLSRVYLGMHYPLDVVFGWVFGFGTAMMFVDVFPLGTIVQSFLIHRSTWDAYVLAIALPSALMVVLGLLCWLFPPNAEKLEKYQKIAMQSIKLDGKKSAKQMKIAPAQWEDYIAYSGILAGILISVIWHASASRYVSYHKVSYQFHGSFLGRVGRVVIGFIGLLPAVGVIVFATSKKSTPSDTTLFKTAVNICILFASYFYFGLWITLVGPETATMLGL